MEEFFMNKHVILLSFLLASAISLHSLSYALEPTPEIDKEGHNIVAPPVQVATEVVKPENIEEKKVTPEETKVATNVSEPKKETVATEKQETTVTVKEEATEPAKEEDKTAMIPASSLSDIKNSNNINKMASSYIPSKNQNEIIKEAKGNAGRLDPFLSIKPPAVEKVPEMPVQEQVVPQEPTIAYVPAPVKPTYTRRVIPKVPRVYRPLVTTHKPYSTKPPVSHSTENPPATIAKTPDLQEGVTLNGIISGDKDQALISVNNKRKVLKVGDQIKPNVKILSIDNETQTITISDDKNRKAKINLH
jgi:hypothetical protein